jgi:hypothetical protein
MLTLAWVESRRELMDKMAELKRELDRVNKFLLTSLKKNLPSTKAEEVQFRKKVVKAVNEIAREAEKEGISLDITDEQMERFVRNIYNYVSGLSLKKRGRPSSQRKALARQLMLDNPAASRAEITDLLLKSLYPHDKSKHTDKASKNMESLLSKVLRGFPTNAMAARGGFYVNPRTRLLTKISPRQ